MITRKTNTKAQPLPSTKAELRAAIDAHVARKAQVSEPAPKAAATFIMAVPGEWLSYKSENRLESAIVKALNEAHGRDLAKAQTDLDKLVSKGLIKVPEGCAMSARWCRSNGRSWIGYVCNQDKTAKPEDTLKATIAKLLA